MGAIRPKRFLPITAWLGIFLTSAVLGQDLPPLPGESISPTPARAALPRAAASQTDTDGSITGRVDTFPVHSVKLRTPGDEASRFKFLDHFSHPAPFRLHDNLDFETEAGTSAPPASKVEPDRLKTDPPAQRPVVPPSRTAIGPVHEEADTDLATVAETAGRLEKLPADKSPEATPASRALRTLLEERLNLLKERARLMNQRRADASPEADPGKPAARCKTELEQLKATLEEAARDRDALLPVSFRNTAAHLTEQALAEMKEAIDAAQVELKDWLTQLEQRLADPTRKAGAATAKARAQRDKTQRQLTSLKTRNAERADALSRAKTPEARELAQEILVNGQWESRVEALRLGVQEAQIALETRRADLSEWKVQVLEKRTQLARLTLDRMKVRYRDLAAVEERDLHRAAAKEETRAEHSADPLERYRARRAAELLELEARVVTNENALAASPPPTYEEQHALAERARSDFADSRKLLDDGKISHLDAMRLNTDFRRLGAVRSRIVRKDLAAAADRLSRAELALGTVETELIYDSRDDRFELDNLMEHLPRTAHPKAESLFKAFEAKHMTMLNRRRAALDKLAQDAEETHKEVLRRLAILDEHFSFIRTHMFWVRDEESVSAATLAQAQREVRQLGRASVRIGAEVCDHAAWGRLSAEFLTAAVGLVVLPWPLRRARRALLPRRAPAPGSVRPDPTPRTEVSSAP